MNCDKTLLRFTYLPVMAAAIILAGIFGGCISGPGETQVQDKVADKLVLMTRDAITGWDKEITRIDVELTQAEVKLGKLNQVLKPALQWVDLMKAQAQKEQWTGDTVEVMEDLDQLKNDQFKVAKLQFLVEMLSAGIKYSSNIQVFDFVTGKVIPYEELRNALQAQVNTLAQQREAKVNTRNTARSTALSVLKQYQAWNAQKVNSSTYNVIGNGLGLNMALTTGTWTYHTDTGQLDPANAAATNLQKVLTGK
jgi:hypothetical protein